MLLSFPITESEAVFETHRRQQHGNQLVLIGVGMGVCTPYGVHLDDAGQAAFAALIEHGARTLQTKAPHVVFVPLSGCSRLRDRIDLALDCCSKQVSLVFAVCTDSETMSGVHDALCIQARVCNPSPLC